MLTLRALVVGKHQLSDFGSFLISRGFSSRDRGMAFKKENALIGI